MTRKKLLSLYKESPIPVYEVTTRTWNKYASRYIGTTPSECNGSFYHLELYPALRLKKPRDFIVLEESRSNDAKAKTLFHEMGHYVYMTKHGWVPNSAEEEAFADKFAMEKLTSKGLRRAASIAYEWTLMWAGKNEIDSIYNKAARSLLDDTEYQKMVSTLGKKKQ